MQAETSIECLAQGAGGLATVHMSLCQRAMQANSLCKGTDIDDGHQGQGAKEPIYLKALS